MTFDVMQLIGVAASTGLVTGVLAWFRFRKKDKAEEVRTYAEVEKVIAESVMIKAQSEMKIGEAWMKMAQELKKQLDDANKRIDGLEKRNEQLEKSMSDERVECDRKMEILRQQIINKN